MALGLLGIPEDSCRCSTQINIQIKKRKKEKKERKKERQKEEKMSAPQRASINTSNLAQVDNQDSFPAESASRPYDGADVGTRHRLRWSSADQERRPGASTRSVDQERRQRRRPMEAAMISRRAWSQSALSPVLIHHHTCSISTNYQHQSVNNCSNIIRGHYRGRLIAGTLLLSSSLLFNGSHSSHCYLARLLFSSSIEAVGWGGAPIGVDAVELARETWLWKLLICISIPSDDEFHLLSSLLPSWKQLQIIFKASHSIP